MLHQHNSYVRSFKTAAEVMDDNTQVDYRIKISGKAPLMEHKDRFNALSVSEVSIMFAGEIGDHFPGYVTDNAIRRGYTVHPNNREELHMLLLLHHAPGPISFEDHKTVIMRDNNGNILEIKPCSTYTDACQVLGLVEDYYHWYQAMEEAAVSQSPAQLRNLFAILIKGDLSAGQFANKLLQIGDGKVPEDPSTDLIIMPCGPIVNSPDELLSKKKVPVQEYAYKSIDCILKYDEAVQYPIEFLISIQNPDLQAHNLILKVCAPIILIRNIDTPRLCNDTRLIAKMLMQHVIQATELAYNHKITSNASKSTVSLFTTNMHLYNYSPELFLISECLKYSKYRTHLGFTLDSEVNCGKHIEKIADKARKRLKILKYLSGRYWGLDTSTLRITYTQPWFAQSLNMGIKSFK
ncbi:ATP-dependent DNA helicase [Trichonephila inaurata madagascariensis]|uniref:ATP-dependent DNA helicase n=1 Tax=Trichonephila inaurata madagascariensis TaxID=2747483 RepID=A0A8X6XXR8_9ARAC|nr:ATP-dependent DNA helicase [Trichonephila inaurata madagascariensis]